MAVFVPQHFCSKRPFDVERRYDVIIMSWDLFFTEDGRAYWHNSSTSESLWAKSNSQSQSNFSSSANYNGSIDKNNTNSFNRIHVKENNETPSIVRNDLRRPLDDIDSVQHTEGFQSYLGNLSGRLLAKRRQETKVNDARKVYVEIPVEDDDASDITTDSDAARFIEFLDSENGEYAFEVSYRMNLSDIDTLDMSPMAHKPAKRSSNLCLSLFSCDHVRKR